MKVLITMMGRSTWGLFNAVWADIRERDYLPDRVHVLTAGCDREAAEQAAKMLRILLHEHGSPAEVRLEVIDEESMKQVSTSVRRIVEEERRQGHTVALDVTPGKKEVVLGTLISGPRHSYDKVFYLHIETLKHADRPYVEIPLEAQHSHDILQEILGSQAGEGK